MQTAAVAVSTRPRSYLSTGRAVLARFGLFARHPPLEHQSLTALVVDCVMAMHQNMTILFKMRACDGFTPGTIGIQGRGPKNDIPVPVLLLPSVSKKVKSDCRNLPPWIMYCLQVPFVTTGDPLAGKKVFTISQSPANFASNT